MKQLLRENDRRRIDIVEYLYEHTGWISYSELAKALSTSSRALRDDVTYLREHHPKINIEASNRGIRMRLDQTFGLNDFYRKVLNDSSAFQALEILFFDETLTVNELAQKLYISSSTMYRIIENINDNLHERYGSYIETNPCRFIGDEFFIRNFYKTYFFEAYTLLDWPFTDIDEEEVNEKFEKIISFVKSDMPFDLAYSSIIKLTVMVNLGRYKHGHLLDIPSDESELMRILFIVFNHLFFSQAFLNQHNLVINAEYMNQVFTPYIRRAGLYTRRHFARFLGKDSTKATAYIQFGARLKDLATQYHTTIDIEDILFNIQGSIFLEDTDPNAIYLLFNRNKYFALILKRYLPSLYDNLYDSISQLRTSLNLTLDEDRINYLMFTLVTAWTNLIGDLNDQIDKVSILVLSNRHKTHAMMIQSILQQELQFVEKIDVYTDLFITKDKLNKLDYDLIVSNFSLPPLDNKQTMIIEHFPNHGDIKEIQRVVNSIIIENSQNSNRGNEILLNYL